MTGPAAILLSLSQVLGGLALFIYGMQEMSRGLQQTAGDRLRSLLQRATRAPAPALTLGTTLGFLLHSSGASVLLVGFLNAGLITLPQALPVLFGANIGTTLSMQAVSLKLTNFSHIAIALGLAATFTPSPRTRSLGKSLFGFGLLFLGMDIMSQGVLPYREPLRPLLQHIDGTTLPGMITGLLLAALITAVIQSSGATIGMAFALVQAGVLVSLRQTMPIILGAHIGTCATALLASIGARNAARRAALAHLLFNLLNVSLCILFREPLISALQSLSPDVVRQSANLHTAAMLAATLLLLPLRSPFTSLILRLLPDTADEPEPSFLTAAAMAALPTALPAVRLELARLLRMASQSLELNRQLLEARNPDAERRIRTTEDAIDAIKLTTIQSLRSLAHAGIDPARLPEIDQWIRCTIEIERIGDHLNTLRRLSAQRRSEPGHILFGRELTHRLNHLFTLSDRILDRLEALLLADPGDHPALANEIPRLRTELLQNAMDARDLLTRRITQSRLSPRAMYYLSSCLEVFERLARHAQILAATAPPP